MGQTGPEVGRSKGRAASVAGLIAVALVALALVDLVLALITPLSADIEPSRRAQVVAEVDADLSILTRQNLFEGAPESEVSFVPEDDLPVTTLQLKLKSVSVGTGVNSYAIIELPSSQQDLFTEGDTIMRGVQLERIELYRAVIVRNGVQEALLLENRPERSSDIPVAETAPSAEPEQIAPPPAQEQLRQIQDAVREGATLADIAGPAFSTLERFGAEPGDIPVAINGQEVDDLAASWSTIFQKAQEDGSLILTVRRDGALHNINVRLLGGINL